MKHIKDEKELDNILEKSGLSKEKADKSKWIYQMRTIVICKYCYHMSREEICAFMYEEKPEYGYISLRTYNNRMNQAIEKIKI